MAGKQNFEGFIPIFGDAAPELGPAAADSAATDSAAADSAAAGDLRQFIFYAHAPDPSRLQIAVSDFHSLTFDLTLTVDQLDDLRDDVGIGGSWSEFVDYLIASLSSGDVKLILGGRPNATSNSGIEHAKLIAHKSKGLPRITLSLTRLLDSSSSDLNANLSVALYRKYKSTHETVLKEQAISSRLKGILSSEREKNESLQKQLDALSFLSRRKVSKSKAPEKAMPVSDDVDNYATSLASAVPEKEIPSTKDPQSTRVSQRPSTTNRRAKVRGVSLQVAADADDN